MILCPPSSPPFSCLPTKAKLHSVGMKAPLSKGLSPLFHDKVDHEGFGLRTKWLIQLWRGDAVQTDWDFTDFDGVAVTDFGNGAGQLGGVWVCCKSTQQTDNKQYGTQ